ncbi:hypothetical protein NC652_012370 [Populus alba x Populus x berolinensis]|nr:hypothetical protein NC652_012370 [Populus alba x Populus x berolinensis]
MGFSFLTANRQKKKKKEKEGAPDIEKKLKRTRLYQTRKSYSEERFALALVIIKMVVLEVLPLRCRIGCQMKKGVSFNHKKRLIF